MISRGIDSSADGAADFSGQAEITDAQPAPPGKHLHLQERRKIRLPQFSLAAMLLTITAASCWVLFTCVMANSPGFGSLGYIVAPLALTIATAAIAWLLHPRSLAVPIAMLIAPLLFPFVLGCIAMLVAE